MPELDPQLIMRKLNIKERIGPIKQASMNFRGDFKVYIKQEIHELLDASFIKTIQHLTWLAISCEKKNGQIRCCINFHDLSKPYSKDKFPLPNVDMLVDTTARYYMFFFIDVFSGYN